MTSKSTTDKKLTLSGRIKAIKNAVRGYPELENRVSVVEQKLAREMLNSPHETLEQLNARLEPLVCELEQLPAIAERLTTVEKNVASLVSRVDSTDSVVRSLGERVAQDHDTIVEIVRKLDSLGLTGPQVQAAIASRDAGGDRAFGRYLRERGVTPERINDVDPDVDPTDSEVVYQLFCDIESQWKVVNRLTDDVVEIKTVQADHGTRLGTLESTVAGQADEVGSLKLTQTNHGDRLASMEEQVTTNYRRTERESPNTGLALIMGAVAAVITWIIGVPRWEHAGLWEAAAVFAAFLIGFGYGLLIPNTTTRTVKDHSTVSQHQAAGSKPPKYREHWWQVWRKPAPDNPAPPASVSMTAAGPDSHNSGTSGHPGDRATTRQRIERPAPGRPRVVTTNREPASASSQSA